MTTQTLDGKIALVSGASRGIGHRDCRRHSRVHGATVVGFPPTSASAHKWLNRIAKH